MIDSRVYLEKWKSVKDLLQLRKLKLVWLTVPKVSLFIMMVFPYELYKKTPELFAGMLADVYAIWQQNRRIPSFCEPAGSDFS